MITAVLSAILLCPLAGADGDTVAAAKSLYSAGRWADVVSLWRGESEASADLDYYAGMSFARLGEFEQAQRALETGQRKDPRDKRFPDELGGLAFKGKDFHRAKANLRLALKLDPSDTYAIDFLGSIYLLEDNLGAALQYWNRTGKPAISAIQMEPEPALHPALFRQAFAIAPAATLQLEDLLATEASLDSLGVFPYYRFLLQPGDQDDEFALLFRSQVRSGWGSTNAEGLISLLRGLPYETIYPEFYNLGRAAVNVTSLVRFDGNKQRAYALIGAPLRQDANRRIEFLVDGRREIWDLTRTFHGSGLAPRRLRLNKLEAGASIRSVVNGRWAWSSGASISDRTFAQFTAPGRVFTNGLLLKYHGQVDHVLLWEPEKRLTVNSSAAYEFGRLFAHGSGVFERVTGSASARWLPQAEGDRYELTAAVHTGRTFGEVPFDELYILGLERDNDLPLGAHIGTRDGRKGSAPLGRAYVLFNWDADRTFHEDALVRLKLGPFLDSGKISDPSGVFGSREWLCDTGARLKLRVLSRFSVVFNYGKDLRTGSNAFYVTAAR